MLKIEAGEIQNSFFLKMHGHCCYEKQGRDIVCSAASILCFTLICALEKNENKLKQKASIKTENGFCELEFQSKKEHWGAMKTIFETIIDGFELLSSNYPENVSLKRCRGQNAEKEFK